MRSLVDGLAGGAVIADDGRVGEALAGRRGRVAASAASGSRDAHDAAPRRRRAMPAGTSTGRDTSAIVAPLSERVGDEVVTVALGPERDEAAPGRRATRESIANDDRERVGRVPATSSPPVASTISAAVSRTTGPPAPRARRPRSSNGSVIPAIVWPVSWPFPAITHDVAGCAASECGADRERGDRAPRPRACPSRSSPRARGVGDRAGILGARVVGRQDDEVGAAAGGARPSAAACPGRGRRRSRTRRAPGGRPRARVPRRARTRARRACARSRRAR